MKPEEKNTTEPWRIWIFPTVMVAAFALIFVRLFYLQVIVGPRVSKPAVVVARAETRDRPMGRSFFSRVKRALARRGLEW